MEPWSDPICPPSGGYLLAVDPPLPHSSLFLLLLLLPTHLQGSLPFDDDNLRVLLEKVKRGHFNIPTHVPAGARELIRGMVEVTPRRRMTVRHLVTPLGNPTNLFLFSSSLFSSSTYSS